MNATAGMSVSRYLQYHLTSLSIYLHPWRVLSGSITRRAGDPRGLQSRIDRQERLWIGTKQTRKRAEVISDAEEGDIQELVEVKEDDPDRAKAV